MRNFIMFFAIISLCVSCSKPKLPTIEEEVLLEAFSMYQVALVYDEVCNKTDPKTRYDTKNKENILLLGNQNLLAARFGSVQHIRFPDKSVDELVGKLLDSFEKIQDKIRNELEKQGCDGKVAQDAERVLKLYTGFHPMQISALLDKKIEERGGTITPPEDRDAIGESPK